MKTIQMHRFVLLLVASLTFPASGLNVLSFPGDSQYVSIPTNALKNMATKFTFEAQVYLTSASTSGRILDHITPGGADGFLLDIIEGIPRVIAGSTIVSSGTALVPNTLCNIDCSARNNVVTEVSSHMQQ